MEPKDVDINMIVAELCTAGMPTCEVAKETGFTFNTGNYTAIRTSCRISIGGTFDNYDKIVKLVDEKLELELGKQFEDMQKVDSSMLTRR